MQIAYRNVHGKYTASFDTLIDFIENGKIPIIKLQASSMTQHLQNKLLILLVML